MIIELAGNLTAWAGWGGWCGLGIMFILSVGILVMDERRRKEKLQAHRRKPYE